MHIKVLDVDEPPVFSKSKYNFTVMEESIEKNIGTVTAKDPDKANKGIRYSSAQSSHTNELFLIVTVTLSSGSLCSLQVLDTWQGLSNQNQLFHGSAVFCEVTG